MIKHKDVMKFIKIIRDSFIGSMDVYTRGSCYHFYEILNAVFTDVKPYYYSKHIVSKINGRFYDITGEVKDRHYHKKSLRNIRDNINYTSINVVVNVFKYVGIKLDPDNQEPLTYYFSYLFEMSLIELLKKYRKLKSN